MEYPPCDVSLLLRCGFSLDNQRLDLSSTSIQLSYYSFTNLLCKHRESCLQALAYESKYGRGRTCDNSCANGHRCCNGCVVKLYVLAFSSPLLALLSVPSELLCFTFSGFLVEQFLAVLQMACQALLIIHTLQRHSWRW